MRMTCIMVLLMLLLQGCGHKGPMYLPPDSASASPSPDQKK
ncbi:MAG: lipoprotein [Gallionellaceae bacterium]|nr:lipoprotein [Gallionellaceae bacterium]